MTDNFYAPPHSIEAEQAVIGGLLLDDDSSERVQKVLAMLKPDSFYSRPHKILFEEITRMHREQKPVDGLTLFDELERKSLTASVGGFAYIAEIAKNTPSAANIVAYAMQVREAAGHAAPSPGWHRMPPPRCRVLPATCQSSHHPDRWQVCRSGGYHG